MSTFLSKTVVSWCNKRYPGVHVNDVMSMYEKLCVDGADREKFLVDATGNFLDGLWRDGRVHRYVAAEIKNLVHVLKMLPKHVSDAVVYSLGRERSIDVEYIPHCLINHLFVSIKKAMPATDIRGLLVIK